MILPVMLVLISGPLYSLVLMASYLKGFVLLEIFLIIFANFLVLKYLVYKGKPFPEIKLLYGESQKKGISVQAKQKGEEETQSMFFTAIFTAWVSPSSVWANNFQCKSYFLLVSGLTTMTVHVLGIVVIYLVVYYDNFFHLENLPVTHCFLKDAIHNRTEEYNMDFVGLPNICDNEDLCLPIVRICSDRENPGHLFFTVVGPIAFALLLASYLATGSLQILGNYFTMFRWSKTFCFGRPIVHVSLLQDYLRSSTSGLSGKIQKEMNRIFLRSLSDDMTIVNQKNCLHGDTCLHVAIDSDMFDLVEKMILSGGNTSLNNNYGENVLSLLEQRKEKTKDLNERERIDHLLALIETLTSKDNKTERSGVWVEQPRQKAIRRNQLKLFCFLNILGGHWNTSSSSTDDAMGDLIDKIEAEEIHLNRENAFIGYPISAIILYGFLYAKPFYY